MIPQSRAMPPCTMPRWRRIDSRTTRCPEITGRTWPKCSGWIPSEPRTPTCRRGRLPEPSDVLLDVGGGAGRVSLALADCVQEIVLVEPSEGMREQFIIARDQAGITNTRITSDWWMDSDETGNVIHLSDVTYFVRDIAPFVEEAAQFRVPARHDNRYWRPTPGDMGAELRSAVLGSASPLAGITGAGRRTVGNGIVA